MTGPDSSGRTQPALAQPADHRILVAARGDPGLRRCRARRDRGLARAARGGRPGRGLPAGRRVGTAGLVAVPRRVLHDRGSGRGQGGGGEQPGGARGGGGAQRGDAGAGPRRAAAGRPRSPGRPGPSGPGHRTAGAACPGARREPGHRAHEPDLRRGSRGDLHAGPGAGHRRALRCGRCRRRRGHVPPVVGTGDSRPGAARRRTHRQLSDLRLDHPAASRHPAWPAA